MVGSCKYSKVTPQQKFHLLTLVLQERMLIKEAAKLIHINYSTAKTIVFFHRQYSKSYQFDFRSNLKHSREQRCVAVVEELTPSQPQTGESIIPKISPIQIICTVGCNDLENCKKDEELACFYAEEKSGKLLLRNYPLTHQNLHAQQKSKTEDELFCSGYRRITRSQAGLGVCSSLTNLSVGVSAENLCAVQNH